MAWLAGLDPRVLIAGIALIGVLLSFPFFLASIRRMRRLKLVRGTLFLLMGGIIVLLTALQFRYSNWVNYEV